MTPIPLIATSDGLKLLLQAIESAAEVFLDTEADSLHHYFEKTCLLQFTIPKRDSTDATHFLVDPLAKLDLAPLFESLKHKLLVLHGADYDLRLLQTDFKFMPGEIFDTMLAARLAGHTAVGLEALVTRYAGQKLDHGSQKADWSQRPLPPRLLDYAVNDTRFLPLIVERLREELAALGRVEWHRQQCAQLIESASVSRVRDHEDAWRIKGSFTLDRQSLAILRELWKWRDAEAREWDRPAFMVCHNERLLEWTAWAREHKDEGGRMRDEKKNQEQENEGAGDRRASSNFILHPSSFIPPRLPPRWRPSRVKSLQEAFQRAWTLPESEWPERPPKNRRPPYNPEFNMRMNRLRAARDAKAREINLDPSLLVPNAMLAAVVTLNPQRLEDFAGIERWLPWQTEVLGKPFLETLQQPL